MINKLYKTNWSKVSPNHEVTGERKKIVDLTA